MKEREGCSADSAWERRGGGLGPSEGLALDQKSSPVSGAGRKDEMDQVRRPVARGSRPMAQGGSTVP